MSVHLPDSVRALRHLLLAALLLVSTGSLLAQRQVTGTVTDENGEPLIGATILVKGTDRGTVTDLDGKFTIEANEGDVLVVSYTGYQSQEVTVGADNVLNITLAEGITFDEVVVTGYTTQSRRNISGAVTSVEASEIAQIPADNVAEALQGKAAGVTVKMSGAPGGGVSLRIRGFSTINSNEPLYILDGIPTGPRAIQDLNPNDIESIQVLKDASAASIYGARASNGVVIITTKKGSVVGEPTLSVDMYYGIQQPGKLPEMLSPQDLANVLWEAQKNAGLQPTHPQYGSGPTPVLPNYIIPAGAETADESAYDYETNPITRANKEGTNWLDEIFDPAPERRVNIAASGGSEKGQYYLSAGWYRQDGVVIHTNYERFNLRANTLFRIKDRIRVGENMTASYSEQVSIPGGIQGTGNAITMAMRMPTIIPVYDVGGNFAGTRAAGMNNPRNPVAMLVRNKDNVAKGLRLLTNAFAEVDLAEGLTAKTSFNVELFNTVDNRVYNIRDIESAEPAASNSLSQRSDNNFNWTWSNTLTYSRSFGDHDLTVLAGTEAIDNTYTYFGASRVNFFSDELDYRQLDAGEAGINNFGNTYSSSLFSIFGKVDYAYKGKYILSATVRRDGSSRFGAANRYGVFPAFSAAWRISDEDFFNTDGPINELKLRAGYGVTGNQEIGDYRYSSTFGPDIATSGYDINGTNNSVVVGFDSRVFGNPDVKWEETSGINAGFDAIMFNQRLGLVFDWYKYTTNDMLIEVEPPTTKGVAAPPFVNVGTMENKGVDLALTYTSSEQGDFGYDIGVNFSTYKNKVVKLAESDQVFWSGGFRTYNATRTEEGYPIASFFGYNIVGIFQDQAEVDAWATQPGAAPGRFKYEDNNGTDETGRLTGQPDGKIDAADRTYIGSPHPDFTFGATFNFRYKDFDFGVFMNGSYGNEIFNANKYFTDFVQTFTNSGKGVGLLDSWGYPGVDNATASHPQLNLNAPDIELAPSTFYIEDGSYLRVRTLTLGYTVPADKLGNAMSRLRIYIQGNNILTLTKYSGFDPEIGNGYYYDSRADLDIGVDRGQYPVVKSWMLGLNASF